MQAGLRAELERPARDRIAATAPRVDAVIAAIHSRSPGAKVFVVGR